MPHEQNNLAERCEEKPLDFLAALQQRNSSAEQAHPDGVYTLGDNEASLLDCLAFVRQGQIIPLFDLKGMPIPQSPEGKMYFAALTVQHIMSSILDVLEIMQGMHQ